MIQDRSIDPKKRGGIGTCINEIGILSRPHIICVLILVFGQVQPGPFLFHDDVSLEFSCPERALITYFHCFTGPIYLS